VCPETDETIRLRRGVLGPDVDMDRPTHACVLGVGATAGALQESPTVARP
jgi:hypothetical protein